MCRCRRLVVTLVWLLMRAADLAYRRATLEVVVSQAQEDLGGLWRSLLSDPVERAAAGMREAVPAVAEVYGAAAAENAAIWYEDVRPAGAPRFEARVYRPVSLAEAEGLATWAVSPAFAGDTAGAWTRLAGTVQRLVADHDRVTVEENVTKDPAAWGWRRRASTDACAYCAYMAVVLDQPDYETAARKYHDDCRCVPVMAFHGQQVPEQPNEREWLDVFDKARDVIDAERKKLPGWNTLKRHERSKKYPEYQLTTKNILARARRLEPDLFRDGVHAVT